MTEPVDEPRDDLDAALAGLRETIRRGVSGPEGAVLRARAEHQLRVRRLTTAGLAAVAVAALAVGGTAVLRPTAGPPVPPAESPTPSRSVTPAPGPTREPVPLPVSHPASDARPAPLPANQDDHPMSDVDWFHATIMLPPSEFCPSGPVELAPFQGNVARAHVDGKVIEIYPDSEYSPQWAYGDLTGDGRPELIMEPQCFLSADGTDPPTGHGGQLLVVAQDDAGTLTGLGWVGPRGAANLSVWVAGGRLLADANPWTGDGSLPAQIPALTLAYEWDGEGFSDWTPAPEYPPILGLADHGAPGAPVRPGAVADGLGCPDVELRFAEGTADTPDGSVAQNLASAGDATYLIPPGYFQQYLFDLDNTGDRLLVTAIECTRADGSTRAGLAVFERAGDGWHGISVLTLPEGYEVGGWSGDTDRMHVGWRAINDEEETQHEAWYRWTGTVLEPIDG